MPAPVPAPMPAPVPAPIPAPIPTVPAPVSAVPTPIPAVPAAVPAPVPAPVSAPVPAPEGSLIPLKKNKKHVKWKHVKWMQEELNELEEGMKKFGTNWSRILDMADGPLKTRTTVQLKDKARNEKRRREREGISLGIFQNATG